MEVRLATALDPVALPPILGRTVYRVVQEGLTNVRKHAPEHVVTIAVVGGGDTAMEEATFLTRFAKSVTVVHRRDSLRASKIMAERAEANPKIRWAWNSAVVDIHGDKAVEGIRLHDTVTGDERDLALGGLFIAIGHEPRSELVKGQVELDDEGYVRTTVGTRTNLDGVFAAGDLVDHTYRQAITAAGTGCQAALDAERYLAALAVTRAAVGKA